MTGFIWDSFHCAGRDAASARGEAAFRSNVASLLLPETEHVAHMPTIAARTAVKIPIPVVRHSQGWWTLSLSEWVT